jgi:hypothetical protein
MNNAKPNAKERQQARREAAAAVYPLAPRYVLEQMARRLGLTDGWLQVRVRNGFVQLATATHIVSAEETGFGPGCTEAEKDEYFEKNSELLRSANALLGIKESDKRRPSTIRIDDYSAAGLLERKPRPIERRPRPIQKDTSPRR